MMINKRLIGTVGESKKYIAGNVAFQWLSLAANIVMMDSITRLLAALFENTASEKDVWLTLLAAAAAVELAGGSPEAAINAAAMVIKNVLGLVCDPVGGLVEYPCQNRNAAGVSNALIAAEMSLAGITQFIPLDEMIDAMYTVGKKLPAELRETALGGRKNRGAV